MIDLRITRGLPEWSPSSFHENATTVDAFSKKGRTLVIMPQVDTATAEALR